MLNQALDAMLMCWKSVNKFIAKINMPIKKNRFNDLDLDIQSIPF